MDQYRPSTTKSSRKSHYFPENSTPEVSEIELEQPQIKMVDVLPIILCLGIIILLYFIVRELQTEQQNQDTKFDMLMSRISKLEKDKDLIVPEKGQSDDKGTYVMKDKIVSFHPSSKDEKSDSLDETASVSSSEATEEPETLDIASGGPVVDLSGDADEESESDDGDFS
tara:strand:+ start:632 stop:1138 length:507 start_codon:yes stop_codon:yes gene_type:complete